ITSFNIRSVDHLGLQGGQPPVQPLPSTQADITESSTNLAFACLRFFQFRIHDYDYHLDPKDILSFITMSLSLSVCRICVHISQHTAPADTVINNVHVSLFVPHIYSVYDCVHRI
ncbi:hypothetical protein EV182_007479, partial [Spiromyces aspiralis]